MCAELLTKAKYIVEPLDCILAVQYSPTPCMSVVTPTRLVRLQGAQKEKDILFLYVVVTLLY